MIFFFSFFFSPHIVCISVFPSVLFSISSFNTFFLITRLINLFIPLPWQRDQEHAESISSNDWLWNWLRHENERRTNKYNEVAHLVRRLSS